MPFNASGIFERLYSWVADRDNGVKIRADRMDQEMDGFKDAINTITANQFPQRGGVRGVAGSSTEPSYTFDVDRDTGMYRKGSNNLGFTVGGTLAGEFKPDLSLDLQGKLLMDGEDVITKSGDTAVFGFQIDVPANKYAFTTDPTSYGLHMKNSDLVGLNKLVFSDATGASEGIAFKRHGATDPGYSLLRTASDQQLHYHPEMGEDGYEVFHDGNRDATPFLRTDAANPTIRMGTGSADNFDGIKYDEAGNAFRFFADQNPDTATPIFEVDKESGVSVNGVTISDQNGKLNASNLNSGTVANARLPASMQTTRLHLTATNDASETSTLNALTLGSLTGDFAKFDTNEVISRSGGTVSTVFWDQVFQKNSDLQKKYFGTDSGADAHITGENFDGDTGVSLLDCHVHRHAIGDTAIFNLRLLIGGFSKQVDSDATFTFRFDIGAFMAAQNWDRPNIVDGGYGIAHGAFARNGGADFPRVPFYASLSPHSSGTYPNTFYFSNSDRTSFSSVSDAADRLNLSAMFVTRISD